LVFNGVDEGNYVSAGTSAQAAFGYVGGGGGEFYGSTGNPTGGSTTVTWNRVQFDGTTLKVWQIAGTSTPPTESGAGKGDIHNIGVFPPFR
jgi:hypothetical protein